MHSDTAPDEADAVRPRPLAVRVLLLVVGCLVLGVGVALLLTAALGSDGYSTLVNGIALSTGISFLAANTVVSVTFVALAWARGLRPGFGTLTQILLVGATVGLLLEVLPSPETMPARSAVLVLAMPVLALGVAGYLGSHTGAGPAEGFALAWDPPVPFRWSYSLVQGGGALVGWMLGAAVGVGTLVVIVLLGPMVDLAARALHLHVQQEHTH